MKNILYLILIISLNTFAQNKYLTKNGTLNFEASIPSFEEVAAKNSSVTAILNTENGEFAALALVNGFKFKNALMEEHFNENYVESHKFPKAIFRGKINDFSLDKLTSTKNNISIQGKLTFHGVTKEIENISAKINKDEDVITMSGSFIVLVSDYNIEIPKIIKNKLSKEVIVRFNYILKVK